MRIMTNNKNVFISSFIAFLIFCCWGCHEDLLEQGKTKIRPGQLTVEEACNLYREYASGMDARSIGNDGEVNNLNPGPITPNWDDAVMSTNQVNSFVNVPVNVTNNYLVKSPYNEDWVPVSQKLVVIQEDATRRRNIYLLNLIPEGEFAVTHKGDISGSCQAEEMPGNFTGLAVYTKLQGGLPVYVSSYREGYLEEAVFLLDEGYTLDENVERINTLLKGYSLQACSLSLSRSESDGGGGGGDPGGGDNWQFTTNGPSFVQDGWTCWNYTDSKGDHYIVADMNGDGRPDTVLEGSANADGDHGDHGDHGDGGTDPFDPKIPDPPIIDTGEISPGGSGGSSHGGGSSPGTETKNGPKIDTTGMSKTLQSQINSIIKALKKIGLSDKVLNHLTVRIGLCPLRIGATTDLDGSKADVLFGDKPLLMTLEKDPVMGHEMYKLVIFHEFYHMFLFGISRDAGSAANLSGINQTLLSFLNTTNINAAHHEYMGYDNARYEQVLREAFPGKTEAFYKYGKWGGGMIESEAFRNLSSQEQDKIKNYIENNKLE